jgi:hypothetical protein
MKRSGCREAPALCGLEGPTPLAELEGRYLSVEDRERKYEKAAKWENREASTCRLGFAQSLLILSNYRTELGNSGIQRIGLTCIRTTAVTMSRRNRLAAGITG